MPGGCPQCTFNCECFCLPCNVRGDDGKLHHCHNVATHCHM